MVSRIAVFLVALLLITLFIPLALAVEVTDIQQSVQENNVQITQFRAETNARISEVSAKIDKFANKEDMTKMLEAHLNYTNFLLNSYRVGLTISWIMTCLATLGAFFGIYFYFKGKRRV